MYIDLFKISRYVNIIFKILATGSLVMMRTNIKKIWLFWMDGPERNIPNNYINWRDGQRKNVVNNVDSLSLRAPWQNGPYKNKHIEQHKTRRSTRRNGHSE